jgi:hypothetical protein
MKAPEEIKVMSDGVLKFTYMLEQPESIQESVAKFGEEDSYKWLLAGRKAAINAKHWADNKVKSTEKMEVGGKTFRVPKELAEILRQAQAQGVTTAA